MKLPRRQFLHLAAGAAAVSTSTSTPRSAPIDTVAKKMARDAARASGEERARQED
jgi:hypothetical protein